MSRRAVLPFLMLMALLLTAQAASAQETSDLLGRVNALRASLGLPAYALNGALSAAAQSQAQWIVDNATIAHTHPDGSGPRSRAAAFGYPSAQVSENIYGGTNATPNDAWVFWMNSPIHYAGLTSTNYSEIGVGAAHGSWGAAYVFVFGNPGGAPLSAAPGVTGAASAGGTSGGGSAPVRASYSVGVDEHGNIKHLVQPGDTLGDIALIYGYTWDDLPRLMELNGIANVRDLVPGSIFLVPPKGGAYTPTPDDRSPTPVPPPTDIPPSITPYTLPTSTPLVVTPGSIATSADLPAFIVDQTVVFTPEPSYDASATENAVIPTPQPASAQIAAVSTPGEMLNAQTAPPSTSSRNNPSTFLIIALAVQVIIIVGAGFEFIRRILRRR